MTRGQRRISPARKTKILNTPSRGFLSVFRVLAARKNVTLSHNAHEPAATAYDCAKSEGQTPLGESFFFFFRFSHEKAMSMSYIGRVTHVVISRG